MKSEIELLIRQAGIKPAILKRSQRKAYIVCHYYKLYLSESTAKNSLQEIYSRIEKKTGIKINTIRSYIERHYNELKEYL